MNCLRVAQVNRVKTSTLDAVLGSHLKETVEMLKTLETAATQWWHTDPRTDPEVLVGAKSTNKDATAIL